MSYRSVHVIKGAGYSILRMFINLFSNFPEAGIKIQQPKTTRNTPESIKKIFTPLDAARGKAHETSVGHFYFEMKK